MEAISYFCKEELLRQANDKIKAAFPKFGNIQSIEIVDHGFGEFAPTASWTGTYCNNPETVAAFADALKLAAELLEEMPCKGAKVTF